MVENWHTFIKESVNFGWDACIIRIGIIAGCMTLQQVINYSEQSQLLQILELALVVTGSSLRENRYVCTGVVVHIVNCF